MNGQTHPLINARFYGMLAVDHIHHTRYAKLQARKAAHFAAIWLEEQENKYLVNDHYNCNNQSTLDNSNKPKDLRGRHRNGTEGTS